MATRSVSIAIAAVLIVSCVAPIALGQPTRNSNAEKGRSSTAPTNTSEHADNPTRTDLLVLEIHLANEAEVAILKELGFHRARAGTFMYAVEANSPLIQVLYALAIDYEVLNLAALSSKQEPDDALAQQGIRVERSATTAPKQTQRQKELPLSPPAGGSCTWQTIFSDGFEGAWFWNTLGDPTWRDTSYRDYSGFWSAWCAEDGLNAPGPYAPNMNAWMIYGPFDLSDAVDAQVTFQFWLDSEPNYDYFKWLASSNGTNFFGFQRAAHDLIWQPRIFSLSDYLGDSSVWFAFKFDSDFSIQYEGAYVDQVVIEKCLQPADHCYSCGNYDYGTFAPTDNWSTHSASIGVDGCRWYRFSLIAGQEYVFTVCDGGGSYSDDTVFELYSGSCNLLDDDDDTCGFGSEIRFRPMTTGFYYLRIHNYNFNDPENYTLAYRFLRAPDPDLVLVSGIPSSVNIDESFSVTITAENDSGWGGPDSAINVSVLYSDGSDDVSITGPFNVPWAEFTRNFAPGEGPIYDDNCQQIPGGAADHVVEAGESDWQANEQHSMSVTVTPHQAGTLWFRVRTTMRDGTTGCVFVNDHSVAGGTDAFDQQGWEVEQFSITVEAPFPPSNDDCSNATIIPANNYNPPPFDTIDATVEPGELDESCGSGGGNSNSVWYRFTPSQSGTVNINTNGSDYDTVLSIFWGTCGSAVEIGCDDDGGPGTSSELTNIFQVGGETYLIKVSDFGSPGGGSLDFNFAFEPSLALPDGEWTVISHGAAQEFPGQFDQWMMDLANRISLLDPGNVVIHTMDRDTFEFIMNASEVQNPNVHHVLLWDWSETAFLGLDQKDLELWPDGYAYAAGDALFAFLKLYGIGDKVLCLVGHSRGAVVVSETTRRLILDNADPRQVIYLDGEGGNFGGGGYQDDRFDAWNPTVGNDIRYDCIYSTVNEGDDGDAVGFPDPDACYKGLDFGGPPPPDAAARLWEYNLGGQYRHGHCAAFPDPPEPIWQYLINGISFDGELFSFPDESDDSAVDPPLDPDDWDGVAHFFDQLLFNGNFEWSSLAGWRAHGGGGNGHVDSIGEPGSFLELDSGNDSRQHSWFWMREDFVSLWFMYKVSNEDTFDCNDAFYVTVTRYDGNCDADIYCVTDEVTDRCNTTGWLPYSLEIPPELRGAVCSIKLWKNDLGGDGLDSEVRVDDVSFLTCLLPSEPTNVQAGQGTSCVGVEVTWNPVADADCYEIWRNDVDDPSTAELLDPDCASPYSDFTAAPGVFYYYWVTATNGCGPSAFSNSALGYRADVPAAPANNLPPDGSTKQSVDVCISWNAVTGATSYDIYWGTSDPPPLYTEDFVGTEVCPPNQPSETYYWYVNAKNACGSGQPSDMWNYTTESPPSVSILAWESCATHGNGVGEACLAIPDDGSFSEPRLGGVGKLRLCFSLPINPTTWVLSAVSVVGFDQKGEPVDLSGISKVLYTEDGDQCGVVEFNPSLPDFARYCVSIGDVTTPKGGPLVSDADRVITALAGDSFEDLKVTNADLAFIRVRRGIDPINPDAEDEVRADIFTDGKVTNADIAAARVRRGNDATGIPDPCGVAMMAMGDTGPRARIADLGPFYDALIPLLLSNSRSEETGILKTADGEEHAYLFVPGVGMIDLGTLGGTYSEGFAISEAGDVVGVSETADGKLHAFLYSEGVMHDLGTLGGSYSRALGVNAHGEAVGVSETAEGEFHGFLWRVEMGMDDLNMFLPPDTDWLLEAGYLIDDDRRILGLGWLAEEAHLFEMSLSVLADPQPTSVNGAPAGDITTPDIDGDGAIGVGDLVALLESWGVCDAGCPADLDGDGLVGLADLIRLVESWE